MPKIADVIMGAPKVYRTPEREPITLNGKPLPDDHPDTPQAPHPLDVCEHADTGTGGGCLCMCRACYRPAGGRFTAQCICPECVGCGHDDRD